MPKYVDRVYKANVKKSWIYLSLSLLLLFASSISAAMSLGMQSGATIIGKPLDVVVNATIDTQQNLADLCVEGDVFYADNRLDKSRVRITAEKVVSAAQEIVIRIRSSVPVNEPIVTFSLRLGCSQKIERRYVVLADLPRETLADAGAGAGASSRVSGQPAVTSQSNTASLNASGSRATPNAVPRANSGAPSAAGTPGAGRESRGSRPASPSLESQNTARKLAPAPSSAGRGLIDKDGARLKLEPLGVLTERDPQLKSSAQMQSVPTENLLTRSTAAALWKALNAQPEDILRDTEKLQALESSVRSLQEQTKKAQLSMTGLNAQLKQAEDERYANPLVYLLIILLLAAIAGLIYLFRRQVDSDEKGAANTPWWQKSKTDRSQNKPWSEGSTTKKSSVLGISSLSDAQRLKSGKRGDVDIKRKLESGQSAKTDAQLKTGPPSGQEPSLLSVHHRDFSASAPNLLSAANAKEMLDFQQQADFFVAIGQNDQAIDVLKSHISETPSVSAAVYLDLLDLYYQTGRVEGYATTRDLFHKRFNSDIPEFELFNEQAPGLQANTHELDRIEATWPTAETLEIIAELLHKRFEIPSKALDLQAYRDLVMLHAVAKDILSTGAREGVNKAQPTADAKPTIADPLEVNASPAHFDQTQKIARRYQQSPTSELETEFDVLASPQPSARLGLDLDLSKLGSDSYDRQKRTLTKEQVFPRTSRPPFVMPVAGPELHQVTDEKTRPADNLIDFDVFNLPKAAPDDVVPPKK